MFTFVHMHTLKNYVNVKVKVFTEPEVESHEAIPLHVPYQAAAAINFQLFLMAVDDKMVAVT